MEERRLAARIGVAIWRRAAQVLLQCLPTGADDEADSHSSDLTPEVLWRVGRPDTIEPEPVASRAASGGDLPTPMAVDASG